VMMKAVTNTSINDNKIATDDIDAIMDADTKIKAAVTNASHAAGDAFGYATIAAAKAAHIAAIDV